MASPRAKKQQDEGTMTFTAEEANAAAAQEESERLRAENEHLKNRVVVLRAYVNRLEAEKAARPTPRTPQDRRPAAKKSAAKRPAKKAAPGK